MIDTPGLRALRLDVDDASELAGVFDDVSTLALRCRFRDCRHQSEPGCAVRESPAGRSREQLHKLQREARRDSLNALQVRGAARDMEGARQGGRDAHASQAWVRAGRDQHLRAGKRLPDRSAVARPDRGRSFES